MKKLIISLNKFYAIIKPVMHLLIFGVLLSLLIFVFLISLGDGFQISFGGKDEIKTQIDGIKAEISSVKSISEEALSTAQEAESRAKAADTIARRTAADVKEKLGSE